MGKGIQKAWVMSNICYTFQYENPDSNRPLGRHRSRWEDNIKIYFGNYDIRMMARLKCLRMKSNGRLS
jgi:hypothetical protein